MSVTNAMHKEIGTIGQRYENRKNKKTGILEERDEKHKQLIFKADDGSSFIVMYSTFRSDWRKVNAGESEIKITPKVSKSDVKSENVKKTKNNPEKKTVSKLDRALSDKEHKELRMKVMDEITESLESLGVNANVRITGKTKGISVRIGKSNKMEVYVVNSTKVKYVIFFRQEVQLPKTYGAEYTFHETFNLKHKYVMDDLHLKEFIKILKAENTNKEEK